MYQLSKPTFYLNRKVSRVGLRNYDHVRNEAPNRLDQLPIVLNVAAARQQLAETSDILPVPVKRGWVESDWAVVQHVRKLAGCFGSFLFKFVYTLSHSSRISAFFEHQVDCAIEFSADLPNSGLKPRALPVSFFDETFALGVVGLDELGEIRRVS
ncbi:hypothetical protein EAS56_17585 [Bradyrhizobium guangzhouense]|uniref:Uncharacterized protein n=1 Tax=Bradyrhizobium guangzhouense TaxID=1325095 RepID=A0ABY0E4X6_9BRAD|nr:hypothetical protein [Bradyrhizobium guangzhouense]RXH12321.1 hypothetical protein EAS56_17585 [Bradyrhizobium guangzhouense]